MRLQADTVAVALRAPMVTAHGVVSDRELVHVQLHAEDGRVGHGEAAPLHSYDGVTVADVHAALDLCRPVLADYPGHAPVADVIARCAERTLLSQALSAIDLALWDLAGRRTQEPVWRLLGAPDPIPVAVNASIGAVDRSGAAREAAEARAAGYGTVKVKVGVGDDPGRLAAVRAFAGPQMAIRIDANGIWTVEEAAAALRALAPSRIELCEEPVHGVREIAALRDVARAAGIPLALDESTDDPRAFSEAGADLVCLKLARCGGITGTLAAAAAARTAGYEVYLASVYDGPLGIAAALHVASLIRPARACGLATLGLFDHPGDPLPVRGGAIAPPPGAGLGDGLSAWYDGPASS